MFDLTEITWTITPSGEEIFKLVVPKETPISGPVVPPIVTIVTDPSIPSNDPVPDL